jgi:hypothetical protein
MTTREKASETAEKKYGDYFSVEVHCFGLFEPRPLHIKLKAGFRGGYL